MIDDFLTSPDDLPPVRPRQVPPNGLDAVPDAPAATSAGASRTALAAGVLIAAAIVGTPPSEEESPASDATAPASRAL